MPNYTRRAVRGAGIVFIMMVLSYFLGYLFRLILARELGVASYGLVYGIIALFGFFSIFMNLGLNSALVKYIAEFKAQNKLEELKGSILIVFLSKLLLTVLTCGILILFSDKIASDYLNAPQASILIKIYGIAIIFSVISSTLRSSFRGFQSMKYYSSTDFIKSVLALTITSFLLMLGFKEIAPILGFTLTFAILPLIYFPLLTKIFPEFIHVKAELSKSLAKKLFTFGIPVVFTGLAGMIFGYTDTILLTYFRTLKEVGLYNVALPTMKVISVIGVAFTSILFPLSSELWAKKRKDQLGKGLGMLYKYALILVFPLALLMFLFPEIILGILFGGEFKAAGGVLRILAIGYLINTLSGVNNTTLSGIGKPKEVSKIMFSGACMNLILNLILIPFYGMEGAAISTTISFLFLFILSTLKIKKDIFFTLPWKSFSILAMSGILIASLTYLIKSLDFLDIWSKLILTIIIGTSIYLIFLVGTKTLTLKEIKNIWDRVK